MRAKFLNGIFEVTEGMKVKTIQDYEGTVIDPKLFPHICATHKEQNEAPEDIVRGLPKEMICEEFYDMLVVKLEEKTFGEFGILNEYKVPVEHLHKI